MLAFQTRRFNYGSGDLRDHSWHCLWQQRGCKSGRVEREVKQRINGSCRAESQCQKPRQQSFTCVLSKTRRRNTKCINHETVSDESLTFSLLIVLAFSYFHVAIWNLFSTWLAHEAWTCNMRHLKKTKRSRWQVKQSQLVWLMFL